MFTLPQKKLSMWTLSRELVETDSLPMPSNLLESPPITPVWRLSKILLREHILCPLKVVLKQRSQLLILAMPSHILVSPIQSVPKGLSLLSTYLGFPSCPGREVSLQAAGGPPQQPARNPTPLRLSLDPTHLAFLPTWNCTLLYPTYTFTIIFVIFYWFCLYICSPFWSSCFIPLCIFRS